MASSMEALALARALARARLAPLPSGVSRNWRADWISRPARQVGPHLLHGLLVLHRSPHPPNILRPYSNFSLNCSSTLCSSSACSSVALVSTLDLVPAYQAGVNSVRRCCRHHVRIDIRRSRQVFFRARLSRDGELRLEVECGEG